MKIFNFIRGLFFIPFLILASENENNLTWIENNLTSIFDSLKIAEYADLDHSELDFKNIKGEKFGFLKNQVISYLAQKNSGGQGFKDSVLIQIEQFDVAIVYEQSSQGFLDLETGTKRKNRILLAGWLETKSANPQRVSLNTKKTFVEKLTTDNFRQLEESPYTFTEGSTIEVSLWVNVVEPVMVSSAVAFLVYLFFSVRS